MNDLDKMIFDDSLFVVLELELEKAVQENMK